MPLLSSLIGQDGLLGTTSNDDSTIMSTFFGNGNATSSASSSDFNGHNHYHTAFLPFPAAYPAASMAPEAAARKWAVIAQNASMQAHKIAKEEEILSQISSQNMAKLINLKSTGQRAAEASQRASAAAVAKDVGMSVGAIPVIGS